VLHAGGGQCLHRRPVLGDAPARLIDDVGADQKRPLRALKCPWQLGGAFEVGGADLHASGGEVCERCGAAGGGDEGTDAPFQQELDDPAAQVATGASDENRGL
jgi:hypothetical protein